MRWLAPGTDAGQLLTRAPSECLAVPADAENAYEVELGRAAFRTPLILGGQAARAGIACETCHRSGRTNPDFDFPGVSGAPGSFMTGRPEWTLFGAILVALEVLLIFVSSRRRG